MSIASGPGRASGRFATAAQMASRNPVRNGSNPSQSAAFSAVVCGKVCDGIFAMFFASINF